MRYTVPFDARGLNDLHHCLRGNAPRPELVIMSNTLGRISESAATAASIGQVTGQVGVEIGVIGGFDARLRLVRLPRRRGEFGEPAFIGWIKP